MCVSRSFFAATLALAVTLAALAGDASKISGSITANGKTTTLKYAYAQPKPDPFDKKKKSTFLLVTDQEVPAAALRDEFEFMKFYDKANLNGFAVLINSEKRVVSGNVYSPALKHNGFSGVGMQTVELTAMTPQRIAGKVFIPKPDDFFGDKYQYSATFDLPVLAPKAEPPAAPLKGVALPAGGGEPAKAYERHRKAVAAGDLKAVKASVSAARAKEMDTPDFKQMFPLMQEMQPKNVKITGGSVDGDTATLLTTAKDGKEVSTGTITLVREGGAWKVEKESWKSRVE
jgi:hypothetical protein